MYIRQFNAWIQDFLTNSSKRFYLNSPEFRKLCYLEYHNHLRRLGERLEQERAFVETFGTCTLYFEEEEIYISSLEKFEQVQAEITQLCEK